MSCPVLNRLHPVDRNSYLSTDQAGLLPGKISIKIRVSTRPTISSVQSPSAVPMFPSIFWEKSFTSRGCWGSRTSVGRSSSMSTTALQLTPRQTRCCRMTLRQVTKVPMLWWSIFVGYPQIPTPCPSQEAGSTATIPHPLDWLWSVGLIRQLDSVLSKSAVLWIIIHDRSSHNYSSHVPA